MYSLVKMIGGENSETARNRRHKSFGCNVFIFKSFGWNILRGISSAAFLFSRFCRQHGEGYHKVSQGQSALFLRLPEARKTPPRYPTSKYTRGSVWSEQGRSPKTRLGTVSVKLRHRPRLESVLLAPERYKLRWLQ